jgi:hypothetical protein
MNTYLSATIATERQRQLIADAAQSRRARTRTSRKPKAVRGQARSHRVSAFLRDLAAASL